MTVEARTNVQTMAKDIVWQTAVKLQLPPKILFSLAYYYVESPCMRATAQKEYVRWCQTGKYSRALEEMCLDILANRVTVIDGCPAIVEYRKANQTVLLRKA